MEIKLHQKMHEKVHFKRRFAHQCCQGAEENSATSGFSLKNVDWPINAASMHPLWWTNLHFLRSATDC